MDSVHFVREPFKGFKTLDSNFHILKLFYESCLMLSIINKISEFGIA